MNKKIIRSALLLLFSLIVVFNMTAEGQKEDAGRMEKTVIFLRPTNFPMDPATLSAAETALQTNCVYDGLTQYTKEGEIIPGLAESWEVSPDLKEFIFSLRKGVRFHDGTEFNAHAVKFSFDRIYRAGRIVVGSYLKNADENSVTVIDDYTVKVRFNNPYPLFLKELAGPVFYSIVSPSYVKEHATESDPDAFEWMNDNACGTGPFKLVEVIQGQRIIFEKNEDYWGGGSERGRPLPKIDKLIFQVVPDSSTAVLMLERGDGDLAEKLLPEHIEALKNGAETKIESYPIPKIVYVTYNVTSAPFDDVNVRKAISYAINYEELIDNAEKGYAERLHSMIPSAFPSSNKELGYTYDIQKAKQFMRASKYPDGFDVDLIYSTERRGQFERVALFIQAYLKEIGINVRVQNLAFGAQLAKMESGDYGMSLMQWGPAPDPQEQIAWLGDMEKGGIRGWNASLYRNREVEQSLRSATNSSDQQERKTLFKKADEILMDEAIYLTLYEVAELYGMRKNINNFYYSIVYRGWFWLIEKADE